MFFNNQFLCLLFFSVLISQLFINNEWHESCSGGKIPVYNPATGRLLCEVEEADSVRILHGIHVYRWWTVFSELSLVLLPIFQSLKGSLGSFPAPIPGCNDRVWYTVYILRTIEAIMWSWSYANKNDVFLWPAPPLLFPAGRCGQGCEECESCLPVGVTVALHGRLRPRSAPQQTCRLSGERPASTGSENAHTCAHIRYCRSIFRQHKVMILVNLIMHFHFIIYRH